MLGIGVVKGYRNLGKAHGTSVIGTTKDNVLHLCTSDITAGKLTENPAHRIRDIRLTASVRSYDNSSTTLKGKHGSIWE